MEELTKKQRAILDYMKAHVAEHTYWPSIRDIQAKFRFASTNAVFGHLQALERKGVLQRIPGAARAYKIVPEVLGDTSETVIRYEGPGDDAIAFESVKFAGSIAAGFPDYTESSGVLDSMQVPLAPSSRRRAPESFALRVRGDSIVNVPESREAILKALAALPAALQPSTHFGKGDSAVRFLACIRSETLWQTPRQKQFLDLALAE